MTDRALEVLWHNVIEVADIESCDGPEIDVLGTQTVATVVCGRVSGELDRVASRDDDGGLAIVYEARIDGLGDSAGFAKIKSDSADELLCLATVAGFLSGELARLSSLT